MDDKVRCLDILQARPSVIKTVRRSCRVFCGSMLARFLCDIATHSFNKNEWTKQKLRKSLRMMENCLKGISRTHFPRPVTVLCVLYLSDTNYCSFISSNLQGTSKLADRRKTETIYLVDVLIPDFNSISHTNYSYYYY